MKTPVPSERGGGGRALVYIGLVAVAAVAMFVFTRSTTTPTTPMEQDIVTSIEQDIVDDIVADLTDRRGLRQEWEGIDDATQEEIKKKWRAIVKKHLKAGRR